MPFDGCADLRRGHDEAERRWSSNAWSLSGRYRNTEADMLDAPSERPNPARSVCGAPPPKERGPRQTRNVPYWLCTPDRIEKAQAAHPHQKWVWLSGLNKSFEGTCPQGICPPSQTQPSLMYGIGFRKRAKTYPTPLLTWGDAGRSRRTGLPERFSEWSGTQGGSDKSNRGLSSRKRRERTTKLGESWKSGAFAGFPRFLRFDPTQIQFHLDAIHGDVDSPDERGVRHRGRTYHLHVRVSERCW